MFDLGSIPPSCYRPLSLFFSLFYVLLVCLGFEIRLLFVGYNYLCLTRSPQAAVIFVFFNLLNMSVQVR